MTEMGLTARHGRSLGSDGLTARPPLTLVEEHTLLLWQVTASAEKLLAAAEHGRWPGAELTLAGLATAVRDFVVQLERHLRNEEDLLASSRGTRDVPGTVRFGAHPHEWYSLTEGSVVDLDALPADQAVAAAVDRLLRMRRGEKVELVSGTSLDPVWLEITELIPGGYRFDVLRDGPVRWRMRVTRRQDTALEPAP